MDKAKKMELTRRGFISAGAVMAAGPLVIAPPKTEAAAGPVSASAVIERDPLHDLPRTQYSHFIEHLGECVKGGIWAEGESDDMLLGGVRHELVDAMRSVRPALIRYPGGCFADGYHWQDGIGPRGSRPRRPNQAWGKLGPLVGPEEDNHFGTDEFMALCQAVGAGPMLTVNVGSGTAAEAADWVEYCNGPVDTRWGAERAKNGHPEPYQVKYWFVGNEIFGWHEIGHQPPPVYVKTFRAYSEAMRAKDPTIKLIAVGGNFSGITDANKIMLSGAGDIMDYLSIHQYVPPANLENTIRFQTLGLQRARGKHVYYDVMGTLKRMEEFIQENVRDVNAYSPSGKKVPLAFDEWNLWFSFAADVIRANYCLRDGLWTAGMLNLFHRHAPELPIANIAQMVNCLGIITSTKEGTFLTPSALAFKLYTERAGESFLPSRVECPPLPHVSELPAVDLSATRSGDRLALFLVNRHYSSEARVSVSLDGMDAAPAAERREMGHRNPAQYNTFKKPDAVRIEYAPESLSVTATKGGSGFDLRLAPHSLTCIELRVKDI
ncbi:MAG TPA: alpha-L-arabinofuranosidase C-terminal domain-containing protein [bacterium]|nr:alpha-L-arabinofuranosidase C-terminal domain-containing protein [bacterium]